MKKILLWDPRFPDRKPARLSVDDALASAAVRAGIAAAADPREHAALAAGAPLDPGSLVEVVVEHGVSRTLSRAILPLSVAMVGATAGVVAGVGAPIVGGGGTDVTPPTITSSASGSVAENAAFSLSLTADETVTWTKTGGADAARFTLTGSTLAMTAKDFEAPLDADANNVYLVQVTATDAAGNATVQNIAVTVTNLNDTTASGFSFTAATDVVAGSTQTSSTITVAGLGASDSASATVSGATSSLVSKNGGAFVAGPVTVVNGDTLAVRHTASASASAATSTTLTVGTTVGTFTSTTAAALTALPQTSFIAARWSADDITPQADNTALSSWTDSVGGIAATQATSANQPKYRTGGQNGKPYVKFAGGSVHLATAGANAALTACQSTTYTQFVVYRNATSASGTVGQLIGGNTSSVTGYLNANSAVAGRWGNIAIPLVNSGNLETIGAAVRPTGTDGGTTNGNRLYIRGCCVEETGAASVAGGATGLAIGGNPANGGYGGAVDIYEVLVWSKTLTSAEMKQVEKWARDKYASSYPWTGLSQFTVFHGNSVANGYGATAWANGGAARVAILKGWAFGTWEKSAATGLNWTQLNTVAVRDIDPLPTALGVPIQLHAWEWNNSGRVASTSYSQCTTYFANRRTAGVSRLVVSTSTDISDSVDAAGQRTDRATYNANIAANWATFADAYAPLHLDGTIGVEGACPAASPFSPNYLDGQHPTDPGYLAYRDLVAPSLL